MNRNKLDAVSDARWCEAAGTAAYLLEADPVTVQRATAATLILISAQLGEVCELMQEHFGLARIEQPFLLERGELFIDQPVKHAGRTSTAA